MNRIRAVVSAELLKLPGSLCHDLAGRDPAYSEGVERGTAFGFGTAEPAGKLSLFKFMIGSIPTRCMLIINDLQILGSIA